MLSSYLPDGHERATANDAVFWSPTPKKGQETGWVPGDRLESGERRSTLKNIWLDGGHARAVEGATGAQGGECGLGGYSGLSAIGLRKSADPCKTIAPLVLIRHKHPRFAVEYNPDLDTVINGPIVGCDGKDIFLKLVYAWSPMVVARLFPYLIHWNIYFQLRPMQGYEIIPELDWIRDVTLWKCLSRFKRTWSFRQKIKSATKLRFVPIV
jgi:hypothetical protein